MSPLSIAAIVLGVIGAVLVLAGLRALWQARIFRFTLQTLSGLLLMAGGLMAGGIAIGVQGYQALVREEPVATIKLIPKGKQRFEAQFTFPDARKQTFELSGDEFYVDAHILKWTPYANMIGLHTMWDLDRVAGRYRDVDQERTGLRTVYPLGSKSAVDLFELRRRFTVLAPLLDAEYGSATFVPAGEPTELDLSVSNSGLLLRPRPTTAAKSAGNGAQAGAKPQANGKPSPDIPAPADRKPPPTSKPKAGSN